MGWLSVLFSGIAALIMHRTGHAVLMVAAIVATIGCFWSLGIMHNHATKHAKRRPDYTGGFYDITEQEAQSVPDWIVMVNMVFSLSGLVLLIIGIVLWFLK